MTLDLGATLSRAWKITWDNKILWIFGILAGLATGNSSPNLNFRGGGGGTPPGQPDPRVEQFMRRLFGEVDPNVLIAAGIGLACLALLFGLFLFVLGMIGRGGLIGGIQLADANGKVAFGEAWGVGTRKFWTVLGIGLIVWLISLLIGGASVVAAATICLLPLACVGFLLIAVLSVYTLLAQIAAVVDNLSVTDALSKAWQVIRANLGSVVVLGLILVVINIIVSALLAGLVAAVLGPAFIGAFLVSQNEAVSPTLPFLGVGLCLTVLIPVLIVLNGIIQSWLTAAWTLAYKQFTGRAGAPAIAPAPSAPAL